MHLSKPSKNSAVKTKDHCPQKNLTPDLSWLSWFRDFWEESIFMLLRVFWENSIFVLTRDFPWFIMERTEEIPVYCGHLMGPYNTRHFFQRTVWFLAPSRICHWAGFPIFQGSRTSMWFSPSFVISTLTVKRHQLWHSVPGWSSTKKSCLCTCKKFEKSKKIRNSLAKRGEHEGEECFLAFSDPPT